MNRIIVLALYARSVVLTEAICHLGEGGFGREVLMLNRPLFELMVDAHWAHADLALAEERFVQHARFKQHLMRRVVARYPDVFDEIAPLDELADEELKQLKDLFGPYGQRSWTARSMHERIAAIETQFRRGKYESQTAESAI